MADAIVAGVMVTYVCDEEIGRKDFEEEDDGREALLRGGEGGSEEAGRDLISWARACFWPISGGDTHSREDRGSGSSLCSTCGCDFADVEDLFFGGGGAVSSDERGVGSSNGSSGCGLVETDKRFLGTGAEIPGSESGLRIFL